MRISQLGSIIVSVAILTPAFHLNYTTSRLIRSDIGVSPEKASTSSAVVWLQPDVVRDTVDLVQYQIQDQARLSETTFTKPLALLQTVFTSLYQNSFSKLMVLQEPSHFESRLSVAKQLRKRLSPYRDTNDHTTLWDVLQIRVKKPFVDDRMYILSQFVFQQDVCHDCSHDTNRDELWGVLIYKMAIVRRDKILFYREIQTDELLYTTHPRRLRKINRDAQHWFKPAACKALGLILRRELAPFLQQMSQNE